MTVIYLPKVMTAVERSKPSNYPPSSSCSEASVIKTFGGYWVIKVGPFVTSELRV